MTLIATSTLTQYIADQVSKCPDYVIEKAVIAAGREFCKRSEVWREYLVDVTLAIDAETSTLVVPATYEATISKVVEVKLDDVVLDERLWEVSESGVITFEFAMTKSTTMSVKVVFLPLMTCANYPDWLMNGWSEAIIAGARKILKSQNQPWRDPQGASEAETEFSQQIGFAIQHRLEAGQSGTKPFLVPRFV